MFSAWRRELGGFFWLAPLGLVLAVLGGYLAFNSASSTYVATRSVLFLQQSSPSQPGGDPINPYLALSQSLNSAAEITALTLSDQRTRETLTPAGSGAEYNIGVLGGIPIVAIDTEAPKPLVADELADELVSKVSATLKAKQSEVGAPEASWIQSSLIASSAVPERDSKNNIVMGVAVTVALTAVVLGVMVLILWTRRWLAGRREAAAASLASTPGAVGVAPHAGHAGDDDRPGATEPLATRPNRDVDHPVDATRDWDGSVVREGGVELLA